MTNTYTNTQTEVANIVEDMQLTMLVDQQTFQDYAAQFDCVDVALDRLHAVGYLEEYVAE
mgnify:CR=1 FL=1